MFPAFFHFRCGRKKGEITALLRHIEGRVASIEQKKSSLIDEIQLAVDMVRMYLPNLQTLMCILLSEKLRETLADGKGG